METNEVPKLDSALASALRRDILLSFHSQFAENQRTREGSFLKFLALLGGVLAGDAFLFQHAASTGSNLPAAALMLFQGAVAVILFSGAKLVATISNNFRRDQHVNVRIRRACGLFGEAEIFPDSYDPAAGLRVWGIYGWMPDFLRVFYWLFIVFQVGALIAFVAVTGGHAFHGIVSCHTGVVVFSAGLLFWSLSGTPLNYRRKLLTVMNLSSSEFGVGAVTRRRIGALLAR